MNAKQELINFLYVCSKDFAAEKVTCGKVSHYDYQSGQFSEVVLKVGHTPEQFDEFMNKMDFKYDNGFGNQEVCGTIWFENGSWAEREDYDGSEWWVHVVKPEIPEDCK